MRSRAASVAGSAIFLLVAPGTIAGYLPWLLSRWRFGAELGDSPIVAAAGLMLLAFGACALLECFARFAWRGLGTPAPILPTRHLVVSGLYRGVRNPMYLAVTSLIVGQALLLGQFRLLAYAGIVWLGFHLFVLLYEGPTLGQQFPADYRR